MSEKCFIKNLRRRRGNLDKYTRILNYLFSEIFCNFILRVEKGKGIINTALPAATVNNKYHEVITKSLDRAVTWNQFVSIHHPELSHYRKSKMSILKFAEEFTRLIIRYTRTSSPNVSICSIKNHYSKR